MGNYTFRFWVPLGNFDCNCSRIELSKDIVIRTPSDYEKQKIDDLLKKWHKVIKSKFILECTISKSEPASIPHQYLEDGRKQIEKAVSILRLYKDEIIGFNLIVEPLAKEEPYAISATTFFHYILYAPPSAQGIIQKYIIDREEKKELLDFFNELNKETFEYFSFAFDYFNKSYIEPYTPRDSLVDLLISLENLYLKGEKLEVSYKLRIRMATILGSNHIERKTIFEDMKKAYQYRSDIVHGEKNPDISFEFLLKIRRYTRDSLKIFIKKPELQKNLDDIILKG